MNKIKAIFINKWTVQFLGLTALSVLIWLAGPLLAIAGSVPLESVGSRVLVIALLFIVWVIVSLIMQLRAGNTEKQLIEQITGTDGDHTALASADELATLKRGFEEALAVLKQSRNNKQSNNQYIYQLPWYAIIGPPGSGKTTALKNCGLHFPLAEKLGEHTVKGVGGTRNCDWWFADNAVFLDTAGRYATQESHQAVDAAGWAGFLSLVKKYRPRRPLNGVIVAISLADLLQQTETERSQHAKAVRSRIKELYQHLGVRLPVYMMFTKTDMVAGFNDFYADLSAEERGQVWGETFSAASISNGQDVIGLFAETYTELLQRLETRTYKRIQEERDIQRRSALLDFPQQMALLKPAIIDFLQTTYAVNRYEEAVLLRGVYFTSGTQEGTPIDRVLSILANAFRLDRPVAAMYGGQGKSFFLTRLLNDVLFPEAELAGQDPKLEKRTRLLQLAAYIGSGVLFASLLALWTLSFFNNQAILDNIATHIADYRINQASPADSRDNFRTLLPKLDKLQAIAAVYPEAKGLTGFGLSQADKVQAGVQYSYERLLRDYFLPALQMRLKERMQGAEGDQLDILYQLLKVYLMFNQTDRLQPATVVAWVRADWDREYAGEPEINAQLLVHLDNLLKLQLDPMPIDDTFVAAVRAKLTQVPLVGQIYSRFKTEASMDTSHDWQLGKVLGADATRVFVLSDGKEVSAYTIPGLFTAYGYSELFLKKGKDFVNDAVDQNWVLGKTAKIDLVEKEQLHAELKKLYLQEYQAAWTQLLGKLKLPTGATSQTVQVLDILSRPDGPLRGLLSSINDNTALSQISKQAAGKTLPGSTDAQTQMLLEKAQYAAGLASGPDPAIAVENQFESLNALVRGGPDKPIALEPVLTQLKNLRDYFMQLGSVNSGGQALQNQANLFSGAGMDVLQQANMEFARLPEPLKSWLQIIVSNSGQKLSSAAKGKLSEMVKTAVASPCKMALNGRYPIDKSSPKDVLLADFAKVFAPNGQLDQFFQTQLKPFIDTSRPQWTELTSNKPLGLSQAAIHQFQVAAQIRDSFFSQGTLPQLQFELKPQSLDASVGTFRLQLEGQEAVYRHGPEQITTMKWPGPNPGQGVRIVFETLENKQASLSKEGAWALFRLLDEADIVPTASPEVFNLSFQLQGMTARYQLRAASVNNPFNLKELQSFRCPESL